VAPACSPLLFSLLPPLVAAQADKIMRVGMTASDIPTTGGIPNNGGKGFWFLGRHPGAQGRRQEARHGGP
jgi:peptide/nickel transport system substrate-binding protein